MANNPFITNRYTSPEYFCDRQRETEAIIRLLTNGNNIALISPRRIGKTDLLHHCFTRPEIQEEYHTFIIDIYSTNSMRDFINVFGKAVLDELKSIGDITNPTTTLDEIFDYLNHSEKPCLVAIDEFQQITHYADSTNVEAMLRTYIQRCSNANFVFSGSQRHLMGAMFTSPSRPFYQSVNIINLPPISLEKYTEFATRHFEAAGKKLDNEVVRIVYEKFDGITSYLQRIMNILFTLTAANEKCTVSMIDTAINDLLDFSSDTYESLLYQMPEKQKEVFAAIVAEGNVKNISGGTFVRKHKLTSASSVLSAVKGLLEKDFITQEKNVYSVYDKFFGLWLRREKMM